MLSCAPKADSRTPQPACSAPATNPHTHQGVGQVIPKQPYSLRGLVVQLLKADGQGSLQELVQLRHQCSMRAHDISVLEGEWKVGGDAPAAKPQPLDGVHHQLQLRVLAVLDRQVQLSLRGGAILVGLMFVPLNNHLQGGEGVEHQRKQTSGGMYMAVPKLNGKQGTALGNQQQMRHWQGQHIAEIGHAKQQYCCRNQPTPAPTSCTGYCALQGYTLYQRQCTARVLVAPAARPHLVVAAEDAHLVPSDHLPHQQGVRHQDAVWPTVTQVPHLEEDVAVGGAQQRHGLQPAQRVLQAQAGAVQVTQHCADGCKAGHVVGGVAGQGVGCHVCASLSMCRLRIHSALKMQGPSGATHRHEHS